MLWRKSKQPNRRLKEPQLRFFQFALPPQRSFSKEGRASMFCPKCGATSSGNRFCTRCGAELSQLGASADVANQARPTSAATQFDTAPVSSGAPIHDIAARSKLLLLLFGVLLLLLVFGNGLWWYRHSRGSVATIATNPTANNQQQTAPAAKLANQQTVQAGKLAASAAPVRQTPARQELWEVIYEETSDTTEAVNALGIADRQVAVIKPGGQLALAYREGRFFGNGGGADLHVFGPPQERVSYLIFVRDDAAAAWQRIDIHRQGFAQGAADHDMGHHGVRRARQILIKNNGAAELSIDAIAAVYKEVVVVSKPPHQHQHQQSVRGKRGK
jgi:hypothetical protein